MWSFAKTILFSKIKTEPLMGPDDPIEIVGQQLKAEVLKRFSRSLSIRMIDAGSCNGCELEIQAINNPYYNIERFGIQFVASPRHADMLLVTGPVTRNMKEALLKAYEATPDPKCVVAIGDCGQCGGVFKDSYAIIGGVSSVIPVNVIVSGCPPTPADIIQGILRALKLPKDSLSSHDLTAEPSNSTP